MQQFLENNSMFVVFSIVLIIWFGISLLLFYLDRKISRLEKVINNEEEISRYDKSISNSNIQSSETVK